MAKLTLQDVTAGYNLATTYNANNDAIETALENTLSRDGQTPNDMQADLDMGGFAIKNLGAPTQPTDACRVIDIESGTVVVSPDVAWGDIDEVPVNLNYLGEVDPEVATVPGLLFWDYDNVTYTLLGLGAGLSVVGGELIASGSGSVAWDDITGLPTYIEDIADLNSPGADRILFWDQSASSVAHLTVSTGLNLSGTSLTLSHLGIQSLSDPGFDRIMFWDDSGGAVQWLTPSSGLTITGTSLSLSGSLATIGALTDPNADRLLFWDDSAAAYAYLEPVDHISITATQIAYTSLNGTFTGTLTGVSGTVNGTVRYSRNGSVVTLYFPDIAGTSNSTAHTITGLPASLYPAVDQTVLGITQNNSVEAVGLIVVGSAGTITLYNALSATFAGTGTEGVSSVTITYLIN